MSTPTRKCGSVFNPSLSLVSEDYNKKFSKCGLGEIFSQRSTTSPYE